MAADSGNIDVGTLQLAKDLGSRLEEGERDVWLLFVDGVKALVHHCQYKVGEEMRAAVHLEGRYRAVGDDTACQAHKAKGLKYLLRVVCSARYDPLPESLFLRCVYTTNYAASLHADLGVSLATPHPLLSAVLTRHPLWRDGSPYRPIPHYCNQMLLFTTGYSCAHQTGFFAFAKANVALELLKNKAFDCLVHLGILVPVPTPTPTPTPEVDDPTVALSLRTVKHIVHEEGLGAFLRPLTIRYPTFKSLVVIHPKEGAHKAARKSLGTLISDVERMTRGMQDGGDVHQEEVCRDVRVATYEDLPLHDLGLVLPNKLLTTTNVDFVSFAVELVAVSVVLQQGIEAVRNLNYDDPAVQVLMLTVFPTCAYRLIMLVLNWVWALDYYKSIAQKYILSKRVANGSAAVAGLLHDMEEQDTRLILVAYYVLWTASERLSAVQVDDKAEALLRTFSCTADFDVDVALSKLSALGLARQDGEGWGIVSTPGEFLDSPLVPWQQYLHDMLDT